MSNYVIADIEWIEKGTFINPTQISAIKVNSEWQGLSHFSEKIKPRSKHFYMWKHIAYTGGTADLFLSARSAFHVLQDFDNWLAEDDVILWWFSTVKETYSALMQSIHKRNPSQKQLVLRDYLDSFLNGNNCYKWSSYDTARAFKLAGRGKEHDSFVDVLIIKDILNAVKFPQELLKESPTAAEKIPNPLPAPYLRYVYDRRANLLHVADSECEYSRNAVYSNNIRNYIKKKVLPCPICLKKEYDEQKRQIYFDIVKRMHCKFIYTPHSEVFHKSSCNSLHFTLSIMGCQKYATAIETGRRPCKICNPTVDDEQKKKPKRAKILLKSTDAPPIKKEKNDVKKAFKRLKQAKEERKATDFKVLKTEVERRDVVTLTSTVYAFYAGKGYANFHLKNCPKLNGIKGINGFWTYEAAIAAGFTPCKTCKPTKKFNLNLSIPFTSKERADEKVLDLYTYCAAYGYTCSQDDEYFYVKTPAGKWKIDLTSKPVRLKHVNFVTSGDIDEYHDQPRIFLSLTDAILYIHKHDNNLLK